MFFVCDCEKLNYKLKGCQFAIQKKVERSVAMSIPVNIDAVYEVILSYLHVGLQPISDALNISYEHIHRIVHIDLDKRKISAKRTLKCLNVDQKHAG